MSCERHQLPLTVLGQGQRWQGFRWKLQLVRDALQVDVNQGRGDDLVAFVDAYDVIILVFSCDSMGVNRKTTRRTWM